MKLIRNPKINAAMILIITAFYALIFISTSGHIEFTRMFTHAATVNAAFWNTWSAFLAQGNMKYIGYLYIVLAAVIVTLSLVRKQDYDEYQAGILEKGFIATGIAMVCLIPIALLLTLSDPNYAIEAMMLLAAVHGSVVLIADFICALQWSKA